MTRGVPGSHVVTHGTVNEYVNYRCRCSACRAAWAQYFAKLKNKRAARIRPEDHGKASTYLNSKCRCQPCCEARSAQDRRSRNVLKLRRIAQGLNVKGEPRTRAPSLKRLLNIIEGAYR